MQHSDANSLRLFGPAEILCSCSTQSNICVSPSVLPANFFDHGVVVCPSTPPANSFDHGAVVCPCDAPIIRALTQRQSVFSFFLPLLDFPSSRWPEADLMQTLCEYLGGDSCK